MFRCLQVARDQVSFKERMQYGWISALWSLRKQTVIISLGDQAMPDWPDSI